ncbi:MAG: AmmeMemoRadiSam system protein A [Phycisphaerae bacterium]
MIISAEDRAKLVSLARQAVEAEVLGNQRPMLTGLDGLLAEKRGCFVTLTNQGRLRGCIGTFQPRGPLGEMIVEMSKAAARDPRFTMDPITPEELESLSIEVSVLSPLVESDAPEEIEVGRDGIFIVGKGSSGCFLPEVATDQGWTATEFLDYCCAHKAGLPPGAWRDPDVKVYVFTSEKFDH